MRIITLLDTSVASTNLGDQIIMEAVRSEISELCPGAYRYHIASHEWMGRQSRSLLRVADVAIVGGSSLLSSHMWFAPLWKITPLQALRQGEIVLMGVGWYQEQAAPDLYSRWLLRRVLSRTWLHSVRDGYTREMLAAAGVTNAVNTACPTLWRLTAERCAAIPRRKAESVVTTLNTYMPQPEADRRLLQTLRRHYSRVFFWTQTHGDCDYARQMDPDLVFIEPSVAGFDRLLTGEANLDYVGNRLHAGIRALQQGRRTIIVEVDNRARAMGADCDLPTVARNDVDRLSRMIAEPFKTRIRLPEQAIEKWRDQLRLPITTNTRCITTSGFSG